MFFPTVLIVGGFWFRLFIPYGSFLLKALLFMAFSQTLWPVDPAIRLSGSTLFSTSCGFFFL